MMLKSFLLFFVLFTLGIEGSEHGYRYNDKTNGWFMFHATPKDWNDAMTHCELKGAILASPLTYELRDAILDIIELWGDQRHIFHTGIFTNFSDGSLHSIEGANVSNLPVVLEKQDCVAWVTNKTHSLRRVQCSEKLPYVCYKNDSNLRCGNDYSYSQVSQSCYKFHRQGLRWNGANQKCQDEGAQLAVADNVDEIMTLRNIYDKYPNSILTGDTGRNVIFIGIRNRLDGRSWMTVDGKPLAETSFEWASTEPNNMGGDEYCGSFGRQGKLYDDSCQLILPYICEKIPTVEIISPDPTNSILDSNAVDNDSSDTLNVW